MYSQLIVAVISDSYKHFTLLLKGIPTRLAYFGAGNGPIHLSRAQCTSSDMRLTNCSADRSGINQCDHREDAGVICRGKTKFK